MKKWLLLLLLPFVLAGCGNEPTATQPTTVPTEPPGLYDPGHVLTEVTYGAIQAFVPEDTGFHTALPMGKNLLLAADGVLVLTEGHRLNPVLTVTQDYDQLYPLPNGVACWQKAEGRILFLNEMLRQISSLQLPADCEGEPFLTPDGKTLYYSSGPQIRAMDLKTGIIRPVFHSPEKQVTLTGILHDGAVLRCVSGGETLILSAENGEILASGRDFESLVAEGGGFFVRLTDAQVPQLVFGTTEGEIGTVWNTEAGVLHPIPERNALLVLCSTADGYRIDKYDLLSGKREASVILPGVMEIWDLRVREDGIWFFCDAGGETLCRWNTANSAVEEDTVYTAPFYTREDPDLEGLAAVTKQANALAQRFGIRIVIGESVMAHMPGDYTFIPEHVVQVYEKNLTVLEQVLSRFPEGFFAEAMEPRGGVLSLCLVRSIRGNGELGTLDQSQGIQFWDQEDGIVAVCLNDALEQSLYHMLMHVMESRIFAKVLTLDKWHTLNPQGFLYDNDYLSNLHRQDTQYLEGENRYFIDLFSMSFAREDRARIFEYASMPGNEALFASPAMQAKLKTLCEAIRKAFDLTKYQEPLPWEQYLTK